MIISLLNNSIRLKCLNTDRSDNMMHIILDIGYRNKK